MIRGGEASGARPGDKVFTLDLGGRAVALTVRRHPRARRLTLRIDPASDGAVITLPRRASLREGLAMAHERARWILDGLDALPARMTFTDGARVPFLGVEHRIVHRPGPGTPVRREDGALFVTGKAEHLARRLTDWFRAEARWRIANGVAAKAAQLGRAPGRITLRDTRSSWGSCSAEGNLSFSWRLVMTPEAVLDYVIAHEVAHLAHGDHGERFWRTVARLTAAMEDSRAWLTEHGAGLHRYG